MKTILITGATDGIGHAMASLYAAQDQRLILVGRKPLSDLDGSLFTRDNYCQADLSQPKSNQKIQKFLANQKITHINTVILNAGTGYYGKIQDQSHESIEALLQVNLYSPITLTHHLLPLVQKNGGKFVYISSVAASLPAPDFAVYATTKAALHGFVRSVRHEHKNVAMQVISPGAINTGLHKKIGIDKQRVNWDGFPSAARVAQDIVARINRTNADTTLGFKNKFAAFVGRRFSSLIDRAIAQKSGEAFTSTASDQKICVITGAAEGIGKALAYEYGQRGFSIVGVDRNEALSAKTQQELLQAGINAQFLTADLASKESITQLLAQLKDVGKIDTFIHNAGISAVGIFGEHSLEKQLKVLDVNLRAPLLLTQQLLAQNNIHSNSSIVLLSSLSYFVSYPGASVYAASKDGLASYGRSLRTAYNASPSVLTVFPGPTRTEHAKRYSPDNSREEKRMTPQELASRIFVADTKDKRQLIPGFGLRVFALLGRWLPKLSEMIMVRTILKKLN